MFGPVAEVNGSCADRFGKVRDTLAGLLDDADVGASAAVYVDGEPVVDIWGGHTDLTRTSPWERDTIVNVWSITKTMTALCALLLADRGDLDLDAPVAAYWPEFAAAGKAGVRVRHLLSHTAGLPAWEGPMKVDDLYDWPAATARLAGQRTRWEPGSRAGYHSLTQGHLVGEVIRRITGRGVGRFFADEFAGPLDADFHIGLAAEHDHRVAPVIPPPGAGDPAQGPAGDAGGEPAAVADSVDTAVDAAAPDPDDRPARPGPAVEPADANTLAWRRAEIPAAGGHGNARSVCAVQSVLACGGTLGGRRFMSKAGCARALETQYRGMDRQLGMRMRYGMGYGLNGDELPISPNPNVCFWGGWGGSLVLVDLDARMTVAYVMNQMLDRGTSGDYRGYSIVLAAYDGLSG
jgi:CubicO group peptidase (beta-lactamase class C family)